MWKAANTRKGLFATLMCRGQREQPQANLSVAFFLSDHKLNLFLRKTWTNIKGWELGVAFKDISVTGFGIANDVQPTSGSTRRVFQRVSA